MLQLLCSRPTGPGLSLNCTWTVYAIRQRRERLRSTSMVSLMTYCRSKQLKEKMAGLSFDKQFEIELNK